MQQTVLFALLSGLAAAHFQMKYPTPRGYNEDTLTQYPCGGQNQVSAQRTPFSLTSNNPVQLDLEHTESVIQLVLALGNNPTGDDFTHILVPTFDEKGPGDFCFGGVSVPGDIGAMDGTNGTLLAITDAPEDGGGFYNCADVVFTMDMISMDTYNSNCMNASSIIVRPAMAGANANGTTASSGGSGGSETSSAAPSSTSGGAAAAATMLPNMGLVAALGALGIVAL